MKHFLLAAAALLMAGQSARAQSHLPADDDIVTPAVSAPAVTSTAANGNNAASPKPVFISREAQLNYVTMAIRNDKVVFAGLDGMSDLKAIITNGEGRTLLSTFINDRLNAINLSRFKAGLYYVTLINENTGRRKAFVVNK